jgi:hypothetical protein
MRVHARESATRGRNRPAAAEPKERSDGAALVVDGQRRNKKKVSDRNPHLA